MQHKIRWMISLPGLIFTALLFFIISFAASESGILVTLILLEASFTLVALFLILCVGIMNLVQVRAERQWNKREGQRRDMNRWHRRCHVIASRNDFLWSSEWYRLQLRLEDLESKRREFLSDGYSAHQRGEMLMACQKTLPDTEEGWMRRDLELNIFALGSYGDFLEEVWRIQGILAEIGEDSLDEKDDTPSYRELARERGIQLRFEPPIAA